MSDRKTLLPELLPEPRPESGQGPRERVAVRAKAMLDRLSGLKTAAGAALLAAHCGGGYGVVDPLPPPPIQCTSYPDPFTALNASGIAVPADGGWSNALIMLSDYRTVGYQFDAVRVTGALVPALRTHRVIDTPQARSASDHLPVVVEYDPAAALDT